MEQSFKTKEETGEKMTKTKFKKLKKGDTVRLNKKGQQLFDEKSFEWCSVKGSINSDHEEAFFVLKAVGQNLAYKLSFIRMSHWPDAQCAQVEIKVGKLKDYIIIEREYLK